MGVLGAAIATIGGQIISCIIALVYLKRTKTFRLHKSSFHFQPSAILSALPLGIASFLTQFAIVLTSAVSNMLLVKYGAESVYGSDIPVAVMGIVMKVFAICVSISIGLAVGSQPILGFNYGAGNYKRVKSTFNLVTILTVGICLIATFVFECFPHTIISIFGDGEPAYIEFAVICFRIYLCLITLTCFQKISGVFLQALGKPVQAVIVSITRDLIFQFALMLILSKAYGIMGLLYSAPIADALSFLVCLVFITAQIKNLGKSKNKQEPVYE